MTEEARSERTARLLALRLEELARALEHAGAPSGAATRLLDAASIATMHAVSLELVSAGRARAIWDDASRRHPVLNDAALPRAARVPAPA
ncbi:MAG: hypothetical protein ICV64_07150 [Thermoleophilia bacterium]|nr:hypothetical protein [Thermoleophilia bacterium]